MTRPPIDRRTAHLVDWRVVIQAYGFLGSDLHVRRLFLSVLVLPGAGACTPTASSSPLAGATSDDYTCTHHNGNTVSISTRRDQVEHQHSPPRLSTTSHSSPSTGSKCTRHSHSLLLHPPAQPRLRTGPEPVDLRQHGCGRGAGCVCVERELVSIRTFGTASVPVHYVLPAIGFGALLLVLDELRKWSIRHHPQRFLARIAW